MMGKKRHLYIYVAVIIGIALFFVIQNSVFHTENTGISHRLQWWLSDIGWDTERTNATGTGIVIAVIDSGIDTSHPDLENRVVEEYRVSGIDQEDETDDKSHGTAVAGVIAASPSDEKGVLGVATAADIVSVDVTDDVDGKVEIVDLVEGIEYAISQNVDIINISVGVKSETNELHNVVKKAYDKGIVIVASAGNYMESDLLYPAKYEEVIAVGSKGKDGACISPTGELEKMVVYLPGENVVTTNAGDKRYVGASGTSIATPILSGIIALMLEENEEITNTQVMEYFNLVQAENINVQDCINLAY